MYQLIKLIKNLENELQELVGPESISLRISNNPETLKQLKVRISENKISSNVFKPQVYTHNIEKGYRKVYENYIDGQKPQNFKL